MLWPTRNPWAAQLAWTTSLGRTVCEEEYVPLREVCPHLHCRRDVIEPIIRPRSHEDGTPRFEIRDALNRSQEARPGHTVPDYHRAGGLNPNGS